MTASANIEIVGAKDAIKALRRIDPDLRKQFNRDAAQIMKPALDEIKASYPVKLPSGMMRNWKMASGFQQFPYDVKKVRKGVKFKIDTRRKNQTVMRIVNTEPSAVFIEFVGRSSYAQIAKVLTLFYGLPGRFMYPAVEKALPQVEDQLKRRVMKVIRDVEKAGF
jgi:hypothetical protein